MTKVRETISVVIPVYNTEKYLKQCIDSVLNQTYHELEIILIDDGSTDNSGKICDEYAVKDARIYVIHQKNGGLSQARNSGIEFSHGQYLIFIDSDDYINKQMIEKLYHAIKETKADLGICDFDFYYEEDSQIPYKQCISPIKSEILSTQDAVNKLLLDEGWFYIVAWNKIYKRELWDNLRFPIGFIHEDEAVIHRILIQCRRVVSIDEKLYYYRQIPGSIMHSGVDKRHLDYYSALADRLIVLNKNITDSAFKTIAYKYWYHYMDDYYLFIEEKDAKLYLRRMRKSLRRVLYYFVKSRFFSYKDAGSAIIFLFSPKLYRKIFFASKEKKSKE